MSKHRISLWIQLTKQFLEMAVVAEVGQLLRHARVFGMLLAEIVHRANHLRGPIRLLLEFEPQGGEPLRCG